MNKLLILGLIGFTACISIFGQNYTENSKDQTLRGSGRVNPSTLAMEFDLPLGSYPGRGIDVPITLSYSSKVWRADFVYVQPRVNNPDDCISLNVPGYAENSASGWTTSLAVPYIEYTGWDNIYTNLGSPAPVGTCPEGEPPYDNSVIKRITIHLPSGETHELRVDDTPYTYPTWGSPPAKDGTYLATDGSNIKYIEDSGTGSYKLLMPDGSFYTFKTTIQSYNSATVRIAEKFTDRNGNFTTYNESNNTWTDTLGRTLTAPLGLTAPASPTNQTYQLPGMTGSYIFRWKQLNGGTQENSALTDINDPNYQLKYMADRSSANPNATPRTSGYLFNSEWSAWLHDAGAPVFNPTVLAEIELPTGQKYKFTYDIYGRVERIYYPTGGEERFVYGVVPPLSISDPGNVSDQMNFGVVDRKVYQTAGQGTPYQWTYGANYAEPEAYKITINNPDGTKVERFLRRTDSGGLYGFENVLAGMSFEDRVYDSANPVRLVSQKLTTRTKTSFGSADWHPRVAQEESRIYDNLGNGISTTTTFEYEGDLNLRDTPVLMKKSSQYAFVTVGSPLPANPVRSSENTFLIHDPNYVGVKSYYTAQNMVGLVTASEIKDGAGTVVSRSETVFDDTTNYPLITPSPTPTQWTPPNNGYRGNPNTVKVWDSTKGASTNPGAYIATRAQFDNFGNQRTAWDALGNSTTTAFDTTHYAFPTSVTSPIPDPSGTNGSNTAFVTTADFDPITGLPLTTTDANGLETRITYDPATLRPLNTKTYFNNVQVGSTAETIYHDETNNYWIKNRAQIDADKWAETITYFDGLGRAWKSEEVHSQGNIFVEKEFDGDGRILRVSNPFRAGETKQWTTNVYDEVSRVKEVILQDGATVKTDYGVSVTAPIGVTKQITDQAGKKRKGISDALGRMIRVIEDPTGQNLNTDYVFDTLGNLRKTIQGEQGRFFMHDSLGRLLYAKQPEQDTNIGFVATDPVTGNTGWSAKYTFDDNGNILTTTDARNISIAATYDGLNRLKTRDYSDPNTPDVSFYYDGKYLDINDTTQMATGSVKGKTTGIKSSVSKANNTSFDSLGRLLTSQQITDGVTYPFEYAYNLSGALIEQTYPSTRKDKFTLNPDGELAQMQSRKNANHGFFAYADSFTYNSAGAVTKMQLGNGKWETAAFNERLQITQIGVGLTHDTQNLLKLEFKYSTVGQMDNNGSMREQKITVPTVGPNPGFTATQSYSYDSLNRIQSATETIAGNQTWKQTFTYDRYGNRSFDAANTTTLQTCQQAVCNPTISTANNRFLAGQGYFYDSAGSVTQDAIGQRFSYNAESHQKEFFTASNQTTTPDATYHYDGEGRRVKKIIGSEVTVFVYDASGKLAAEYSTTVAPVEQAKVSYLTTDHLESPRIITDQNATVISRKDFTTFGDAVTSSERVGGPTGNGYDPPTVRQDYTGYKRDEESGLEYAQARYYNVGHGRFTSPDPLTASITVRDPQSFNRYSYVLNSPYKFTDPLGLLPMSSYGSFGGGGGFCPASATGCEEGEDITTGSIIEYQKNQVEQEKKRQEEGRKKRQGSRRKKQQARKPVKPAQPKKPSEPPKSRVEGDSSDPTIAGQNAAFTALLTDGNGVARTSKGANEVFYNGGASHFRFQDGQIIGIHVYGDESGSATGNLYIPDGFEVTWHGRDSDTATAYNRETGDFIVIFHLAGVNSQRDIDRNMKTKNAAGSRLIGQVGGSGADNPGYIHSCLKIFKGYAGYQRYNAQYNPKVPSATGVVDRAVYSDFRNLIK